MVAYIPPYERQQGVDAANLANLLNLLKAQSAQSDASGQNLAGNAIAAPDQPDAPQPMPAGPTPPSPGMSAAPNPPPVQNVPMPGAVPMQGGMPGGAQPGDGPIMMPQVSASQLQPPQPGGGGAPPIAAMRPPDPPQPGGAPAPQPGGAPAPQAGAPPAASPQPQVPWWKSMAAQIKQQNPQASGRDIMAAINAMQPVMNSANRQQLSDLHVQLALQKLQSGQGTPEEIDFLAEEVAAGNQSILTRMPAQVRLAVMEKLEKGGTSGTDASNSAITYGGKQSEAKAAGRRTGNIDVAVSGAQEIAPKALSASAAVPRSSWLLAAKMGNWIKEQTNDPALAKFQVFNLGLSREYAQAFGGTVSAQQHAQDVLGTAKDQTAYKAAVEALQEEMAAAQKGGEKAISKAGGGKSSAAPTDDAGGAGDGGIDLATPPPPEGFVVQ